MLEKFFIDQLRDIYYAGQQLTKALAEMKEAATTEEPEDAFEHYAKQTDRHIRRLEKVFRSLRKEPEGKKCEAIEGLIREAKNHYRRNGAGYHDERYRFDNCRPKGGAL